jgi:hypothetical protein
MQNTPQPFGKCRGLAKTKNVKTQDYKKASEISEALRFHTSLYYFL